MFDVGRRIKYFRTKRGLTVNKLANLAGISQSYLRDIELGKKNPTVEYLEYICYALNISLVVFFNDAIEDDHHLDMLISSLTPRQRQRLAEFLISLK